LADIDGNQSIEAVSQRLTDALAAKGIRVDE
jgi:hypothetical protein